MLEQLLTIADVCVGIVLAESLKYLVVKIWARIDARHHTLLDVPLEATAIADKEAPATTKLPSLDQFFFDD